jgi:hypothetical protein
MSGELLDVPRLLYLLVAATLLAATLWPRPPPPAELSSDLLSQPIDQAIVDDAMESTLDTEFCPLSADTEKSPI